MIRLMKLTEFKQVAEMLEAMIAEVFPEHYLADSSRFEKGLQTHIDCGDAIYVDDALNGFFVIQEVTDELTPTDVMFEGTRLYIKPAKRKTRLLADFYNKIFEDFPDTLIGATDINSDHIPVLEKRHTRIANVYKLNRR